MTAGTKKMSCVKTYGAVWGKMCLSRMWRLEAPMARAASTSWLPDRPNTIERTRIVRPGQLNATSSSRISHSCEPKTKTKKISSGSSGTLLTTSAERWMSRSVRPPLYPESRPRPVPMAVLTVAAAMPMSRATGRPKARPSARSRPLPSVPSRP